MMHGQKNVKLYC